MSEGQWIESATLDLWEGRHREQLNRIKELEAKLAQQGTDWDEMVNAMSQQDDLVQAAVAAREAQKAYFKDRSRDNLIASKQAEAALDKMLAAIREGGE